MTRSRTTTTTNRKASQARRHYWLTPKAWNKRCSHCGNAGSVAVRPLDHRHACESCIEQHGIRARESKAWREGGSKAGSVVRVRYVDPATLRGSARS